MNEYTVATELDEKQWWEFVSGHPNGNVFQSPDILEHFRQTKNYTPVLHAVLEENKIAGLLMAVLQKESSSPLGYFSARTIVWGGPLIKQSTPETENIILDLLLKTFIDDVKGKSIYIQIRNLADMSAYETCFKNNGFSADDHLNFIVDTTDRAKTEKQVSKSKLRQVRKSIKTGASIVEAENIEQVKTFYHILEEMYLTKVKRPMPDWSFFETFYEMSQKGQAGKYLLIKYENEIIGGIMCPITKDKTIYEWYICGLDGKFKGVYPSILATWAPIDYALNNNLKCFDFMGAGKPDKDYGVREFKEKFGGDLVKFGRFERINNKLLYKTGKIGLKVLGNLKGKKS
ncbi:MAG: peptidoglycan bridge formation glycyltransferase FemA/FemB family protein [bacterium]|nr:peptidoglycan bridge formation glycyltransferase FemA/FemB family protein [bacterium]